MDRLILRTIYFLLITLVINAGGWTFNKDAVADVWFDEQLEQHSLVVNDNHSSDESEVFKPVYSKIPCNHWCHSIGHFVGLHSQFAFAPPEFINEYSKQQPLPIHLSLPDGTFRPPRLLS